jgi:hypothetical protein
MPVEYYTKEEAAAILGIDDQDSMAQTFIFFQVIDSDACWIDYRDPKDGLPVFGFLKSEIDELAKKSELIQEALDKQYPHPNKEFIRHVSDFSMIRRGILSEPKVELKCCDFVLKVLPYLKNADQSFNDGSIEARFVSILDEYDIVFLAKALSEILDILSIKFGEESFNESDKDFPEIEEEVNFDQPDEQDFTVLEHSLLLEAFTAFFKITDNEKFNELNKSYSELKEKLNEDDWKQAYAIAYVSSRAIFICHEINSLRLDYEIFVEDPTKSIQEIRNPSSQKASVEETENMTLNDAQHKVSMRKFYRVAMSNMLKELVWLAESS